MLQYKLQTIFAPRVAEKRRALLERAQKVAHYTSAQNAMQILQGNHVWLRNVKYMNDYQEFTHGFDMMLRFFSPVSDDKADLGRRDFFSALQSVYPGMVDKIIANFNSWVPQIQNQTFVACVSEHPLDEDDIGRLSMWRGYGHDLPPVALVLNPDVFYTTTDALGAYSSPVIYQSPEQFFLGMQQTAAAVIDNSSLLKDVGQDAVEGFLFESFLHYAVCQKHRGFSEEREWRILHIPRLHPAGKMIRAQETIRNRPQLVYKLPLRSHPEEGLTGVSLPELLNKVIIGPTSEPQQIREAFAEVLEGLGVPDADRKVIISETPYRSGL